jgi:glycosyltransferase involved in cell wall biosynthesis
LGPSRAQQKALARQKPILFHAHFGPDACDVITLVRALNIPLVVSLHGYDVNSSDDHLPQLYLRRRDLLKSEAARFVCISDFIRTQAIAKGFPAGKTVVHYTGIDTDLFSPSPNVPREPVILFVGRLAFGKGCEYLIRAMAHVQKVMPEVRLVVIGQGPQRQELERQAAALLRNFEFLGVQMPASVKDWMNRATVFSSPSFTTAIDQEGFGMAFAEAQAMGLPVVSSSIGGIPEAVAHEKTGFLVPERDSEALATCLLTLLRNKALWATFSQAGQDRVDKLFNIRRQAALLEAIYESVLTERMSGVGAEASQNR